MIKDLVELGILIFYKGSLPAGILDKLLYFSASCVCALCLDSSFL